MCEEPVMGQPESQSPVSREIHFVHTCKSAHGFPTNGPLPWPARKGCLCTSVLSMFTKTEFALICVAGHVHIDGHMWCMCCTWVFFPTPVRNMCSVQLQVDSMELWPPCLCQAARIRHLPKPVILGLGQMSLILSLMELVPLPQLHTMLWCVKIWLSIWTLKVTLNCSNLNKYSVRYIAFS